MRIKKAVIVAAGLSSRLYPLTKNLPKGLLQVGNEKLLLRSINILKNSGIDKISIVVGFLREKIINSLGKDITYITNPFYKYCNNMGSLWFAKNFVSNDPFIYLHGDIIYDEQILVSTLHHFEKNKNDIELVTDFDFYDEESMKVCVDENNYLIESKKEIDLKKANGEWIGLTYIRNSKTMFKYFESIMFEQGLNFYDTHAFTQMTLDGYKIFCSSTQQKPWIEIDFLKDLKKARELFE